MVMIVKWSEIEATFHDLISGKRSREDVAKWASLARETDDIGELRIEPPGKRDAIWDALLYLTGVDLRKSPNDYLHSNEDFVDYCKNLGIL
jgi:hypothetical protein